MTEPTDFEQTEAALPGLAPGPVAQGPNEVAARRTLVALRGLSLIREQHAVICEALLTAARQLDRAASSSNAKDYGVANLLAQLRETYLVLVPVDGEGGERSAWDQFLTDLTDVAKPERGGTSIRDTA